MNKTEFITAIADKTKLPKKDVEAVVNAYHETVVKAVKKDDKVAFVGFGTYKLVKRAARSGRNPQTGEAMKIKASKSLGFKGSKTAFDKK